MWRPDVAEVAEVAGDFVRDTRGRTFQARRIMPTFTAAAHDRKDGAEEANVERHREFIEAFLQNKERVPLSTLAAHLRREGVVLGVRLVRALQILGLPFWTVGATNLHQGPRAAVERRSSLSAAAARHIRPPKKPCPPVQWYWCWCCRGPAPVEQTEVVVHLEQTVTYQRMEPSPLNATALEAGSVAAEEL
jgi:hypothetical protein